MGFIKPWVRSSQIKQPNAHLFLASEGVQLLLTVLLVLLSAFYEQVDQLPDILVVEELQEGVLLGGVVHGVGVQQHAHYVHHLPLQTLIRPKL